MREPQDDAYAVETRAETGALDTTAVQSRAARARATEERRVPEAPSRWSVTAGGLDIFWPILAVILVVAVVFVASVARSSMDSVGAAPTPSHSASAPTPSPTVATGTLVIVQISSHPSRATADAAAKIWSGRGFDAQVLDSDGFRPLNRGFFVVYTGPYPDTATGRAQAKQVQARLPGSLIREIHRR